MPVDGRPIPKLPNDPKALTKFIDLEREIISASKLPENAEALVTDGANYYKLDSPMKLKDGRTVEAGGSFSLPSDKTPAVGRLEVHSREGFMGMTKVEDTYDLSNFHGKPDLLHNHVESKPGMFIATAHSTAERVDLTTGEVEPLQDQWDITENNWTVTGVVAATFGSRGGGGGGGVVVVGNGGYGNSGYSNFGYASGGYGGLNSGGLIAVTPGYGNNGGVTVIQQNNFGSNYR